jgi:hypothetical protein
MSSAAHPRASPVARYLFDGIEGLGSPSLVKPDSITPAQIDALLPRAAAQAGSPRSAASGEALGGLLRQIPSDAKLKVMRMSRDPSNPHIATVRVEKGEVELGWTSTPQKWWKLDW